MTDAKRHAALGWRHYPIKPDAVGGFAENLNVIQSILGTICYEWTKQGNAFWIRSSA